MVLALTAGCASDDSSGGPLSDAQTDFDTTQDASSDLGGETDATDCQLLEPPGDSDGDGLLDIIEDANRNCIVEPSETDPFDPDTDNDGVSDGDEDVDKNGVWNVSRGETDPRSPDSDSDGVGDADELTSLACRIAPVGNLLEQRATLADGNTLFLPGGYQELTQVTPEFITVRTETSSQARFGVFVRGVAGLDSIQRMVDDFMESSPSDLELRWNGERVIGEEQWVARLQLESFRPVEASYLLGLVAAGLAPDVELPQDLDDIWSTSEAEISSGEVQIVWLQRDDDPLLAIAFSTTSNDESWFRRIHPRALSPSADSRLRVQCSEVSRSSEDEPGFHVVVPPAIKPSGRAMNALEQVRALLDSELVSEVVLQVAPTKEQIARRMVRISSLVEFDNEVAKLVGDSDEQPPAVPLWTELEGIAAEAPSDGGTVVLVAADAESEEFLTFEDGLGIDVPLPNGAVRSELVRGVVQTLDANAVELIVAGPAMRSSNGSCEANDESAVLDSNESSYRTIVRALGGGFANVCTENGLSLLRGQLGELLGAAPYVGISRQPIWGSGVLTNREKQSVSARFNKRNGRTVVSGEQSISGVDAGLSFTFWEQTTAPE